MGVIAYYWKALTQARNKIGVRAAQDNPQPKTTFRELRHSVASMPADRSDMLQMLADLTPEERKTLRNPDFITGDEAGMIVCDSRMAAEGPPIPAEEIFAGWATGP